jgi:hypothetical protein
VKVVKKEVEVNVPDLPDEFVLFTRQHTAKLCGWAPATLR